eukprot:TRINITY_DN21812_c0_g1_i1.p1 TRINITY_DN21812_c0_g1~~TRINITY_DN21812_c0_g1_i1.p1  ORF type:complete len:289 (-),score=32.81 TRINITY_DN21812_c0_g1_i1:169-1035(-)
MNTADSSTPSSDVLQTLESHSAVTAEAVEMQHITSVPGDSSSALVVKTAETATTPVTTTITTTTTTLTTTSTTASTTTTTTSTATTTVTTTTTTTTSSQMPSMAPQVEVADGDGAVADDTSVIGGEDAASGATSSAASSARVPKMDHLSVMWMTFFLVVGVAGCGALVTCIVDSLENIDLPEREKSKRRSRSAAHEMDGSSLMEVDTVAAYPMQAEPEDSGVVPSLQAQPIVRRTTVAPAAGVPSATLSPAPPAPVQIRRPSYPVPMSYYHSPGSRYAYTPLPGSSGP